MLLSARSSFRHFIKSNQIKSNPRPRCWPRNLSSLQVTRVAWERAFSSPGSFSPSLWRARRLCEEGLAARKSRANKHARQCRDDRKIMLVAAAAALRLVSFDSPSRQTPGLASTSLACRASGALANHFGRLAQRQSARKRTRGFMFTSTRASSDAKRCDAMRCESLASERARFQAAHEQNLPSI